MHANEKVHTLVKGEEIRKYANLWEAVQTQKRDPNAEDKIVWRGTVDGEYTKMSILCSILGSDEEIKHNTYLESQNIT